MKARPSAKRLLFDGPAGPYIGVTAILLAMIAYLAITQSTFLTYDNLINILQTNAVLLVVSIGLTLVLLIGGFDLSLGGMLALCGVLLAELLLRTSVPAGMAIALVVLAGFAMGAVVNGLPIAWLGLSFFVVTIGTMSIFRGLALVITEGQAQGLYTEPSIRTLGTGTIASVPYSVVIALAILVLFVLILRYTGYGRMIYAVGGTPRRRGSPASASARCGCRRTRSQAGSPRSRACSRRRAWPPPSRPPPAASS